MTSTALYRAVMEAIEQRREALGLPMWKVDDMAGTQDGFLAKMIYPDGPNGRQSRWETVQLVIDALFPEGISVKIESANGVMPHVPGIPPNKSTKSLQVRHWRHTRYFRDMGIKGGRARFDQMSPRRLRAHQRLAAKIRWKKWRQRQREKT